jgi:hypothetical protein
MADLIAQVAQKSGTFAKDWKVVDGPDSGSGVDYWFVNERTKLEAYVNVDQDAVSISISQIEG